MARFGSLLMLAGSIFCVAGVRACVADPSDAAEVTLPSLFWGLVMLAVGARLSSRAEGKLQKELDRDAPAVYEAVREGERPHYWLYLRAFDSTGHLKVDNPDRQIGSASSLYTPPSRDLERMIRDSAPSQRLIALGTPGEHIGAGRLATSEPEWQQKVSALIDAADLSWVVPSARQGTMWEVLHILKAKKTDRAVFIMPPALSTIDMPTEWQGARQALYAHGVTLPKYDPAGMVFTLKPDGTVGHTNVLPSSPDDLNLVVSQTVHGVTSTSPLGLRSGRV